MSDDVLWNLIEHVNEVARLNTLLNHISHLSTLVQHDIEKANNVLLAIHGTAAGKITTVNSQRKRQEEVNEKLKGRKRYDE